MSLLRSFLHRELSFIEPSGVYRGVCLGVQVLTPDQRRQVYVSNTFFMSSLLKEKSDAEAHRRLTRWLRKEPVPLPERDLILIPIHHKYQHWSLAVVVCPWRAVHATSQKVRISPALTSGDQVSQNGVVQPSFPLKRSFAESKALPSPSVQHRRKRLNCDRSSVFSPGVGALSQIRPARRVDCRQRRPAGPHALTPPQQKAALFHVDSMGLRSIFDRNRSRLKQFIKRVSRSQHFVPNSLQLSVVGVYCLTLDQWLRCLFRNLKAAVGAASIPQTPTSAQNRAVGATQ